MALAVLTVAVYWRVPQLPYFSLDDADYAGEGAPLVQAGLTWPGVAWAFTTFHAWNWHPLTWLSLQLDVSLWGNGPLGHHLMNLLLHIASAIVLFAALQRMTGALWPSAVVAGLFALHPLHVESVAWVAERKDVLSGLFWMLTLLFYGWYVDRPSVGRYLAVAVSLALGLLAKPMLVTLPCVLLLLDYWPLKRGPLAGAVRPVSWRLLLGEKVPLFLLVAGSCVVTTLAQYNQEMIYGLATRSFSDRLATACVAAVTYLGKALWPRGLAVFYPYRPIALISLAALAAAGTLVLLTILAVWQWRRRPYLLVGWLWYLGTLVPVIGLVPVGYQAMADRYTYIPLIGFFIALVWWGAELFRKHENYHLAWVTVALAFAMCCTACQLQVMHWSDNLSLWQHTHDVIGDYPITNNYLALALGDKAPGEAIRVVDRALGKEPRFDPVLYYTRGKVHYDHHDVAKAAADFRKALDLQPNFAGPHYALGKFALNEGKLDDAVQHFQAMVASAPESVVGRLGLAEALTCKGQLDLAADQLNEALRLSPYSAPTHLELGKLRLRQGRLDKALPHLHQAAALSPQAVRNRLYLAQGLYMSDRTEEALTEYATATTLAPRWQEEVILEASRFLAHQPSRVADARSAVEVAEQACQATQYRQPIYLDTLAIAYAEVGDFTRAATMARKAIQLLEPVKPDLAAQVKKRLEAYEKGSR
jgi:tetratricopeptide (TPR) repeat protein